MWCLVMASGRDALVATVDIVCGTLEAKLHTNDLSAGPAFVFCLARAFWCHVNFNVLLERLLQETGKWQFDTKTNLYHVPGVIHQCCVMGWLRRSLSFSLLCSAIQCVRGACSSIWHHIESPPPMDLVRVKSNMSLEDDPMR